MQRRQQDRLGKVLRRRPLGVDDEVDPELLAGERVIVAEVLGITDPRDGPAGTELMGGQRGDHVDLVALSHRTQQIGPARVQILQEPRRCTVAGDDERVELALHRLHPPGVGVHDSDVIALRAERPRGGERRLGSAGASGRGAHHARRIYQIGASAATEDLTAVDRARVSEARTP